MSKLKLVFAMSALILCTQLSAVKAGVTLSNVAIDTDQDTQLYAVHWTINGVSGNGGCISRQDADAWAAQGNATYGPGTHWVVACTIY